jgi:Protein of unknown function (DUF3987)/Primase C terminal 2 (PriCT-2)
VAGNGAAPILITWAATSQVKADRAPIGKVWTASGKWPVTAAVQRAGTANTYAFETVAYRDLEEAASGIFRRIEGGLWTMVAGAPRPELDLSLLARRLGSNFHDVPTTLFIIDVDGLTPDKGEDLSKPDHFGDAVVDTIRARLAKAGVSSLAEAKFVLLATASTGFSHNSKGEPAHGCARFRILFETGTPLTLGQQKAVTEALGQLPGFEALDPGRSCFDTGVCTVAGNIFVAPAQGIADPVPERVLIFDAEDGAGVVDVEALAAELALNEVPPVKPEGLRKPAGDRVMKAPPERIEALLSALVQALPNEPDHDREKWIGAAHAIWGAADGADYAYDIWAEWCSRWPSGDDPLVNERAWNTLPEGRNGIDYLLGWARNVGSTEAAAAVQAIELALFPELPPGPPPPPMPNRIIEPYNFWPDAGLLAMPEGLLPQRIETYARSASIVVGADEGGFAMAALTIVAGSIDDAIKLQVLPYSKWLERARLWTALVGDPSTKKTPIISTTCEALEKEDAHLWRVYQAQREFWNVLPKADKARTPPPVRQRYIVGDATVEALQEAFKHTERGLLGLHDELGGWFAQMDRYSANNQGSADRSFMLKAYNGGRCPIDRIGRGESLLENVSLTVLGGIQPEVLNKFAGGVDDGLIQRLTPIMLRPGWPPQTDQTASAALSDFNALIPQILALRPPQGGCLRFDDGAQAIRDTLAQEHDTMSLAFAGVNKKLSTALAKQDAVFARLCIVWHCVEHADNKQGLPELVTEDTARRVAAFMDNFTRPHLFDFYETVLKLPEEYERLASIAGYILTKKLKVLANWRMQAAVRSLRKLTSKDITPVLETMEALGWLGRTRSRFGAPPTWAVNPAVHDGRFAEQGEKETKRREEVSELIKKAASKRRQEPGV